MSGAARRERILARVRDALEGREAAGHPGSFPGEPRPGEPPPAEPPPPGEPRTGGGDATGPAGREPAAASPGAAVAGFAAVFRAAGGEVVLLADEAEARAWLRTWLTESGLGVVGVTAGAGVGAALRPPGPDAPAREAGVGVSRALAAAADTGTLLLGSAGGRAGQLLPPVHLVWVAAEDVHPGLGAALRAARGRAAGAVLALHSGPSKSADIGRIVVRGVHGPGRVVAAVVGAAPDPEGRNGASGHPVG